MANPLAVIGLTFDVTDVQTASFGIFLEIESGLHDGLEVRGVDTIVPGLAGEIARNRAAGHRMITLVGWVSGTGTTASGQASTFRDNCQAVAALFSKTASPANLVASLENGTTVTIAARTVEITFGAKPNPILQKLRIDLKSVAPNWT